MTSEDPDGIGTCTEIIRQAGGSVVRGLISYEGFEPEVTAAIRFLVEEWDYGLED